MINTAEYVEKLNKIMFSDYLCVNSNKNYFAKKKSFLSKNELGELITQYSIFPKNIISFFITALYNLNYHTWTDISSELMRNLNEELGEPLKNDSNQEHEKFLYRPHYVILREGIFEGLKLDIKQTTVGKPTQKFLETIKSILDEDNPNIIAGAVYALESSAIPELQIIFTLTEQLFKLNKTEMSASLKEFFLFHIDEIEVGHRDRLIENCSKYILSEEDIKGFERGFRKVLAVMDIWWSELSEDIMVK